MKKIISLLMLLLASQLLFAQTKVLRQQKKEAQYIELKALIESKLYRFEANMANPTGFRPVHLMSHPNTFEVIDTVVVSNLPFFGTAYSAPINNEGGIKFKAKDYDYQVKFNDRKQRVGITIKVNDINDSYQIYIEATPGGSATLTVVSRNRSSIMFYGSLNKWEQ
jgi:hypothetical protein